MKLIEEASWKGSWIDTMGLSSPNRGKNGRIYSYLIRRLRRETYKEKNQNNTTDFSMAAVADHVTVSSDSYRRSPKEPFRPISHSIL